MNTPSSHRDRTLGLWLGVLGVAIFAVTLPATRLATGTSEQPQLSPWFVTVGRAALAGLLSAVFLLATRSPRPQPQQWRHLGWAVLGNALGYPLLLAFALRSVTASHAAVVTALLPLVTAAVAALVLHQRARLGFWLFAVLGSLLVVAFSLLRGWQQGHGHAHAALQVAADLLQHFTEIQVAIGLAQAGDGADDRHPGLGQAVHLPAEDDQLVEVDMLAPQFLPEGREHIGIRRVLCLNGQRRDALAQQLAGHRLGAVAVDNPGHLGALGVAAAVTERRHQPHPPVKP